MTTWTQLQADVIAWSDRTNIADQISRFVAIFEDRLRRNLRVSQMEAPITGTLDADNELAKPSGFLAVRAVWPDGYPTRQLTAQSLESVVARDSTTGPPTMYARLISANVGPDGLNLYEERPGPNSHGQFRARLFSINIEATEALEDEKKAHTEYSDATKTPDGSAGGDYSQIDPDNGYSQIDKNNDIKDPATDGADP